ncbi:Rid family hydrolase [Streptomyces sp. NPDC057621]|uniref:Rid family hydrolase n=1 Tax=Streptomyces sp. NPDC057621 TaxID=3346186 RepID=UPI0036CA8BDB
MLTALDRNDLPEGLQFSLGYKVAPGSRLIFLGASSACCPSAAPGGFAAQTRRSLDFIRRAAARADQDAKVVKVRRYMTGGRGHRERSARALWADAFGDTLPPSTALEVPGSVLLGSFVDLEAWAVAPADFEAEPMSRIAGAGQTPEAVSVRGDQRLCVAAVEPAPGTSVIDEFRSCLSKIDTAFDSQGAAPEDIAKLTVYFRDPRSWPLIEAMIVGRYGEHSPVVNGVVVSNLRRMGGHVELTGWARVSQPSSEQHGCSVDLNDELLVLTGTAAMPVFVGGLAADAYAQMPSSSIEEQAHVAMENQRKVLEAAGATFDDVFRSNWYLTDIRDWDAISPIVTEYFGGRLPTPQVVEVARLTAKPGVRFEPDLWACLRR